MPRRILPLLLLGGFLSACTEGLPTESSPMLKSSGGGSTGGDIPVTSVIADADAAVAPALQIRSDGLGAYRHSGSLTSIIQGIGAWLLDSKTPKSGTRQVVLDFGRQIAGNPVPSDMSRAYRVRIISKCDLYPHYSGKMQDLAPGTSMACPLHIAFDYAGGSYAVRMNSGESGGVEQDVTVTCVSPAGGTGPCVEWRMTPAGEELGETEEVVQRSSVGTLLKYVTSKGKTTAVEQGRFRFAFSFRVTNP